jgi:ribonuclease D
MPNSTPPEYRLITTTQALQTMVEELAETTELALDTEFMREKTYYPQLCLIQLATAKDCWLIDPLAAGIDLAPLRALLTRHDLTFVLHSAKGDLEVLWHGFGQLPQRLFDTQVAARFLGYGEQVSYAELALRALDLNLNKSARGTDWSMRPLKTTQLVYAAADVQHLPRLAAKLRQNLIAHGRQDWLLDTASELLDPTLYQPDISNQWRKFANSYWKLPRQQLLFGLLQWRDEQAMKQDRPRRWVLSDDAVQDLAESAPKTLAEVAGRRVLSPSWREGAKANQLLAAIQHILTHPPALPPLQQAPPLTSSQSALLEMLKLLLKLRAEEMEIAPSLLATALELQQFAAGQRDLPMLTGWRAPLFGDHALNLANGSLSLSYRNGQIAYVLSS